MSNKMSGVLGGPELLRMIIDMTGLPHDLVRPDLDAMIVKSGHSVDSLTMEQVREIMQLYLEHTLNYTASNANSQIPS